MKKIFKKQKFAILCTLIFALFTTTNLFSQESDLGSKVTDNDIKAVKELIASGVNINQQVEKNGDTPLMIASALNYEEMAKLLISGGADVNWQNERNGYIPLMTAAFHNHEEMAKFLISEGADIDHQNKRGTTSLILACSFNCVEMAKLLISEGADVNIRGKDSETALIAAGCLSQELVELLLLKGADVNAKKANGTGVFTACMSGVLWKSVTLELAEILLSRGVDIDEARTSGGSQGFTNLIMAVDSNNEVVVRFLIKNGANVNAKTRDGSTALSLAEKGGYSNIIDILKSNGAK